ncbi:MAG: cytochrome c peroxidase [Sedimenticola sp.]
MNRSTFGRSVVAALLLATAVDANAGFVFLKEKPSKKFKKWQDRPIPITEQDFQQHSEAKVELGKNLFYDKILSGNKNNSCGTCHHSLTDTGDGLSLPLGEGGVGLGRSRTPGEGEMSVKARVPRNAPPVFNLGAYEYDKMFHDGRVARDPSQPSGYTTPVGLDFPSGVESALAAQSIFPMTSPVEMAGHAGENPVGDARAIGMDNIAAPGGVWDLLVGRLREIPEYVEQFQAVFDDVHSAEDITIVHVANALGAFEAIAWRADNTPFDRYLRGEKGAMSKDAIKGMKIFFKGDRKGQSCAQCHSGKFLTDHQFHAIGVPPVGPGPNFGESPSGHDDFGRENATGLVSDRYKFKTPPLRNVALTAPYGHNGAFRTLRAMVEHHINVPESLRNYDRSQAVLPSRPDLDALDFIALDDVNTMMAIEEANELKPFALSNRQVDHLMAFLNALTDPDSLNLMHSLPETVPSGLVVAD